PQTRRSPGGYATGRGASPGSGTHVLQHPAVRIEDSRSRGASVEPKAQHVLIRPRDGIPARAPRALPPADRQRHAETWPLRLLYLTHHDLGRAPRIVRKPALLHLEDRVARPVDPLREEPVQVA